MVRRGVAVLAGAALAVVTWATRPGTVYTVVQVAAGLAQHPRAWVGRTVTVRGTFAAVVNGNPYGGIGFGSCAGTGNCTMQLPTNVALHNFLVGPTPRGAQAYARMVATLLAAHAREQANCTKAETLALLRRNGEAAVRVVRALDDAQLDS